MRGLRGATTVVADDAALVRDAVRLLLAELIRVNHIRPRDVISAIFSATPDLRSLYPAAAAREFGWSDVPMLCVTEMDVGCAPPRCIRVLLHLSVPSARPLRPVYLHEARALRPDLFPR
jgi:chorismate mutase